jgi:hypothetical protein
VAISALSFHISAQQETEYRLKLQNFEGSDYKLALGQISNLFVPCTTSHSSDGTLLYTTKHDVDTTNFSNEILQLGYVLSNFEISINSTDKPSPSAGIQKAINQDCDNGTQVCSNITFSGNSNGIGTQELNLANHGCLVDDERQSSWYYLYVGVSGTLGMTITPANGQDDYDFGIWGPFTPATLLANCAPTAPPIRCNFTSYPDWFPGGQFSCGTLTNPTGMQVNSSLPTSSDACTDEPFSRHLDVLAGEIYIMIIDNWSTSLDPFDITWSGTGELDCTTIPLPTEFTDFQINSTNHSNLISWTTLSERNNDYFEIQRRSESKDWTTVNEIDGAGNSTSPISYQYLDNSFSPVLNYYRVKQTDFDGTISYHEVVSVDNRIEKEKIQSCTNMMGQEVAFDAQCVKIIIYKDGSKVLMTGF